MHTYRTAEVAKMMGIHPNTVRFYEKWGLITKPVREENGYRVFTDLHLYQIQVVRLGFEIEILQNGLRKKIVDMIKTCAKGDVDGALRQTEEYLTQLEKERMAAEEAIRIVQDILQGDVHDNQLCMKRKEVSMYLDISVDALRNWEMNGLLTIKRKQNGYRIYTDADIRQLKIIRVLRCANYLWKPSDGCCSSSLRIRNLIFGRYWIHRNKRRILFLSATDCCYHWQKQKKMQEKYRLC